MSHLYFAYGSNMWQAQMRTRCPQSLLLGPATLHGYRWIINTRGYANIVADAQAPRGVGAVVRHLGHG